MLEDVLTALQKSVAPETVVVGDDSVVHEVANRFSASYISASASGLNPAVEKATEWCVRRHADSVLVLPADIPLVSSRDVDTIVKLGSDRPSVVLSPSQNGGTSALFQNPPNLTPACFGPKSFRNHFREACSRGICVRMYYSLGIGTDIDSAEDLKQLFEIENSTTCRRVLEQFAQRSQKIRSYFAVKTQ